MKTGLCLVACLFAANLAAAEPPRLKVVQCWDDSLSTDIPLTELLRKYQAKATFNIIPRETRQTFHVRKIKEGERVLFSFPNRAPGEGGFPIERLTTSEMPAIYKGFKVAAHCFVPQGDIPEDSAKRLAILEEMKNKIRDVFGQPVCGYVYPGGAYNPAVIEDLRKAGYVYARTTRRADAPLPLDDPLILHPSTHWATADFWKRYEEAKAKGGAFYFWGHSCELGDDPELWAWLESILARISADPDAEWADIVDLFDGRNPQNRLQTIHQEGGWMGDKKDGK
jgi:peptidoglycan/xylan/chitin deacetylase (PgdA/CDA1 family)